MRLLRKHKVTLSRQTSTGIWNEDGTCSETRTDVIIHCLVQPTFAGSQYQKILPSGVHQKDCREIYTHHKLIITDERSQIKSDYITFEGKQYEIFENNEWDSSTGRLTHHRAKMIRRDALNGSRKS
jgi:hypothetical protein